MCCQSTEMLGLPAEVIEMLARYHRLLDERGWDWGDEQIDFYRWARFSQFGPVFAAYGATRDWGQAIRSVIGSDIPAGVVVLRIDKDGRLRVDTGRARPARGLTGGSDRDDRPRRERSSIYCGTRRPDPPRGRGAPNGRHRRAPALVSALRALVGD